MNYKIKMTGSGTKDEIVKSLKKLIASINGSTEMEKYAKMGVNCTFEDATLITIISEDESIKERLEELRTEIRAERISMSEIVELQSLAKYIDKGDVELLQWAGVKENVK